MSLGYPIAHYPPIRESDGGGGSIKVPDIANEGELFIDAIVQADGETTIEVQADQPILIGDFIRISHERYARN